MNPFWSSYIKKWQKINFFIYWLVIYHPTFGVQCTPVGCFFCNHFSVFLLISLTLHWNIAMYIIVELIWHSNLSSQSPYQNPICTHVFILSIIYQKFRLRHLLPAPYCPPSPHGTMSLTHAYLHHLDAINHTIEHILQFINSDGACARRGTPSRATASRRLRTDQPGVFPDL